MRQFISGALGLFLRGDPTVAHYQQLADAQDAIAAVCAERASASSASFDAGYAVGQADAYRAAATMIRTLHGPSS